MSSKKKKKITRSSAIQSTTDTLSVSNHDSTNVLGFAGAHFALTWGLLQAMLATHDPILRQAYADFGTAVQAAFLIIYGNLRANRLKSVGFPTRLSILKDNGDAIVSALNVLLVTVFVASLFFAVVNFLYWHR